MHCVVRRLRREKGLREAIEYVVCLWFSLGDFVS
jgi:hypothetical protein